MSENTKYIELVKDIDKIYSIHYSCSGFYNGDSLAPTIVSISVTKINSGETRDFSVCDCLNEGLCLMDAEKKLLTSFVEFCKSVENLIFINWKMESLYYGFKAINARCENFGIYDFAFYNLKTVDISEDLVFNLETALKQYNSFSPAFLSGKEELNCFQKRSYNLVKYSTNIKSKGIAAIFKKNYL